MLKGMCKGWCGSVNGGLLVLRIGVGFIFIYAGWMKVADLGANAAAFATMGFAPFWAHLVAFVELFGGIAVLLGVYTRVAAGLLAIVMLVAVYLTQGDMAMVMTPLALLFSTLALKLAGGGKYSLMHGDCGSGCGTSCDCKGDCNCSGGAYDAK